MVFQSNFGVAESNFNQDLAYDLRMIYAKIVGEHLEDIARARKANNFSVYYETLNDLFVIVRHKIKNKKVEDEDTEKEIKEIDLYYKLLKEATELANKHSFVWVGKDNDPQACAEIKQALNKIEMFLYNQIDKANMFGSSSKIPGL